MILPAYQVHQGSELRSLEPAVATTHFAPQEASSNLGAQHPTYHQFLFRDACKSLLMTGRPYLAERVTKQILCQATYFTPFY